jgi:hypothetical protein
LGEGGARFGDPFNATQAGSFADWLNESPEDNGVTRLWRAIYEERPDVRRAFPNISGSNRRAFLRWTEKFGAREHGIAARFLKRP